MRALSYYKTEIRRRTFEKEKKQASFRRRIVTLSVIGILFAIGWSTVALLPKSEHREEYVYLQSGNEKTYTSFSEMVKDSDLIFIGTLQSETILEDRISSENIRTECLFSVDRCIVGEYGKSTVKVTVRGGTVGTNHYVLEGSVPYRIGETYILFLRKQNDSAIASFSEFFYETSALQGRIHLQDGKIDFDESLFPADQDLTSFQSTEDFVEFIFSKIPNDEVIGPIGQADGTEAQETLNEKTAGNGLPAKTNAAFSNEEGEYYGRFGRCDIFFIEGPLCVIDVKKIAGYHFIHSSSFALRAVCGEETMNLSEAFDRGLLTADDIAELYRIHKDHELRKYGADALYQAYDP